VQEIDGATIIVVRGTFGTTGVAHAAATLADVLEFKVFVPAFARDFFGSPASGSYSFPVFLPNVRVAAAELHMTNSRGNSETRRVNVTGTTDRGLRTLSGGEATIQVDGALAIQTAAAPPLVIDKARAVGDVRATVGIAPTGEDVILQLRQESTVYCTLTIPAGDAVSNIVDGSTLPPLEELSTLWLDILSLGQTVFDSPGKDLTVTLRF
jgi:hypothetical protein